MSAKPASPISEIKGRLSILDVVQPYVPLTKAGRNYKGLCPFHNEKTPSFMVSPELGMFKCFGCGVGGDLFEFIQQIEGVDFSEALKILGDKAGVEVKSSKKDQAAAAAESLRDRLVAINALATEFYHYILTKHQIGKKALNYLHKRGIADKTIKDFKLGYAPNSWQSVGDFLVKRGKRLEDVLAVGLVIRGDSGRTHDRFRGRIMIPFINLLGEVVGFTGREIVGGEPKYLNSPESSLFTKSNFLFGLNASRLEIKKAEQAVLVEGHFDFLAPYQAGFKNLVAAGGTALTLGQLNLLKRYTKNINLCFDGDKAGDLAMRRAINLAERLGFNVRLVILPPEFKDPDECVQKDPEAFAKAIKSPLNAYDFYLQSAAKRLDLTDVVGKKEAGAFLLPLLREIANPIEQSHYLQKVAEMLAVSVEVVTKSMRTAVPEREFETAQEEKVITGLPREDLLLSLLLKSPINDVLPILDELAKKDFSGGNQGRFEFLRERLLLDPELNIAELLKESAEPDFWQNLYLADTGDFSLEVLVELAKTLRRDSLKKEIAIISKQLKQAEAGLDEERINKLKLEFKAVSGKLSAL